MSGRPDGSKGNYTRFIVAHAETRDEHSKILYRKCNTIDAARHFAKYYTGKLNGPKKVSIFRVVKTTTHEEDIVQEHKAPIAEENVPEDTKFFYAPKWTKTTVHDQLFEDADKPLFKPSDMADEDVQAWVEEEDETAVDAISNGEDYYGRHIRTINDELIEKTLNRRLQQALERLGK